MRIMSERTRLHLEHQSMAVVQGLKHIAAGSFRELFRQMFHGVDAFIDTYLSYLITTLLTLKCDI